MEGLLNAVGHGESDRSAKNKLSKANLCLVREQMTQLARHFDRRTPEAVEILQFLFTQEVWATKILYTDSYFQLKACRPPHPPYPGP
jgi:hypothetical protein